MIKKITLYYLFFGFLACVGSKAYSQINFSNPNIQFTQACASSGFNTFNFSFSFFPASALQPGNQFIVELSNSSGSFASPTVVKVLTNTTSPVSSNFSLPTNAYGEGYRIRVRSTAPVKVSNPSNAFAAYYAIHNQPFAINSNVGTVSICENDTYTLQIDDTGTPASPLYYPALQYVWLKDFTEIPGETGPSLTVDEPGSYYVIVDYGSCTLNSYSNIVQVQVMSTLSPAITSENNETIICPGGTNTLTSSLTDTNYTYQWYRDNVQISGATGTTYAASEEGVYHLAVANGPCVFESDAIVLDEIDFNLLLDPATATTLIPGETTTLTAIDDANTPSYQWYKDNVAISGATLATYEATEAGVYKVAVTQTAPCLIIKESQVSIVYPDSFNLTIQPATAYNACVSNAVTLDVSVFEANTTEGPIDLTGNGYGYAYQWYRNDVAVTGAATNQIVINDASQNGTYKLIITVGSYGDIISNTFDVNLAPPALTITGDTIICENSSVLLASGITDPAYSFQWYQDGAVITGAVAPTLSAAAEGDYYVIMSSGTCTAQSNTIAIQSAHISVTTSTTLTDIILPGETKVLAVTTDAQGPAYAWTRNGIAIAEPTGTLNATQDGEYIVAVSQTVGCAITEEQTFILEYPTGFNLIIATTAGYTACTSATTTLETSAFIALTSEGDMDITGMGYAYQWYKNDVAITGATASALNLNSALQNGVYKLGVTIPDFGIIFSNNITIDLAIEAIAINNNTVLCEGSDVLLTSTVNDGAYSYQWYKDNTAITGATAPLYSADAEGDYHLIISSGACTAQSNTIALSIAEITVTSTTPETDVIIPGQTKTLSVITDAQVPTYSWTRNGITLTNTTASLDATEDGEYIITVTQTSGCNASEQKTFTLEYPSAFDLAINTATAYSSCSSTSATLQTSAFTATTTQGVVDVTSMGYALQWYLNDVPVAGAIAPTLNISNASQNGDYKLGATIPGFGEIFSNTISINLALPVLTISSNTTLCEGSNVVLSADINNIAYSYQWFKDGTAITGATALAYTADAEGAYHLEITVNSCTAISNTLNLAIAEINVTTTNPDTVILIPGETQTLSVTTDAQSPAYSWSHNGSPISGTTATANVTEAGEYIVTVTQMAGCTATAEKIFILEYPTAFDISITADGSYTACSSATATLSIGAFTATTSGGDVDVTTMGYSYQWYRNGDLVAGATSPTLTLNNASQNGNYSLVATVPNVGLITSNDITIILNGGSLEIVASGELCPANPSVIIAPNVTDPANTYTWFKDGVEAASGNTPEFTATQTGNYYLVVNTGSCTLTSNTIAVTESDFTLTTGNNLLDFIIPGESFVLSVSTDALQPEFTWYRNGAVLTGETGTSLSAILDGEYKIVATQTADCIMSKEITFTLAYPTNFEVLIDAGGYIPCNTTTALLSLIDFSAETPNGPVDILGEGYGYQWYHNGVPVTGATENMHEALQNGDYYLEVVIPEVGTIQSNSITLQLGFVDDVVITADGNLCSEGGEVTLTSDIINPQYTYKWYSQAGSEVLGTGISLSVTEAGGYYLAISYQNCIITSNILEVEAFDMSQVMIDTASLTTITEGTVTVVTASGADEYEWFLNNTSFATGASVTISEEGNYSVVATVGECSVTKTFTVNTTRNELLAIPNVITPNNDGYNDKWSLPEQYLNNPDTEIIIYNAQGKIVFRQSNYNNSWPEADFEYPLNSPVFYYTIMEDLEITKRGSITLIK